MYKLSICDAGSFVEFVFVLDLGDGLETSWSLGLVVEGQRYKLSQVDVVGHQMIKYFEPACVHA